MGGGGVKAISDPLPQAQLQMAIASVSEFSLSHTIAIKPISQLVQYQRNVFEMNIH